MEIPEMMKLRPPLSSDLSICFNICVKGTWARWVLAIFQVSSMLHYSFRNQSLKLYKGLWKCNKCKQLHDFTAIFFLSHLTFQEAERTPHTASSNSHLPTNPGSLPPIWDPQFGRIILLVWDRKGCPSFIFLCFMHSFHASFGPEQQSRWTVLAYGLLSPVLLGFCFISNDIDLDLLTRVPEVHESLGIHVGLTAKKEGRKGGRREGRGGENSIHQNKTFSLFHFSHSTER